MAQKTSSKSGKKRSKEQQAIFRRRRIVVGIAVVVLVSFLVFCLYSLSRGIVAVSREIHHADAYAISRKEVPSPDEEEEKRGAGLQCDECCAFVDSCGVESRRGRFDGFYDGYQI